MYLNGHFIHRLSYRTWPAEDEGDYETHLNTKYINLLKKHLRINGEPNRSDRISLVHWHPLAVPNKLNAKLSKYVSKSLGDQIKLTESDRNPNSLNSKTKKSRQKFYFNCPNMSFSDANAFIAVAAEESDTPSRNTSLGGEKEITSGSSGVNYIRKRSAQKRQREEDEEKEEVAREERIKEKREQVIDKEVAFLVSLSDEQQALHNNILKRKLKEEDA